MRYFLLIVLLLPTAKAQPLDYLFAGSGLPEAYGWSLNTGTSHLGGGVTVTPQFGGAQPNFLSVQTSGGQYHLYGLSMDYVEFLTTVRVKVLTADYTSFDAGFYFSGTGTLFFPDRVNGFFLTPSSVGFVDGEGPQASFSSDQFHDFSLLLRDGLIRLFVDDTSDDILTGVATPELVRAFTGVSASVIMFGDQSNEYGVNSQYQIESVRFHGITVPEPSSLSLLFCGALLLRRRRTRHAAVGRQFGR